MSGKKRTMEQDGTAAAPQPGDITHYPAGELPMPDPGLLQFVSHETRIPAAWWARAKALKGALETRTTVEPISALLNRARELEDYIMGCDRTEKDRPGAPEPATAVDETED